MQYNRLKYQKKFTAILQSAKKPVKPHNFKVTEKLKTGEDWEDDTIL